ncbi:glycosyl hydrolase 115 family protein [Nonomuraea diastatica]|uniref:glycosyl hydrolase 115 family protein n=1 Tax=Nonomuraea diastatica TaxID=1848329 RepID=UPI003CCC46DE
MNDLYNAGLKDHIPGDVTLTWAEDNQGYLRQVPTRTEAARSGGTGVYYHISYIQPYLAVGLDVLPEQRGQPAPVGGLEQRGPLGVGQDVLQHQRVDVFSELIDGLLGLMLMMRLATSRNVGMPRFTVAGVPGEFLFRSGEADLESFDSPSEFSRSAPAMRASRLSRMSTMR